MAKCALYCTYLLFANDVKLVELEFVAFTLNSSPEQAASSQLLTLKFNLNAPLLYKFRISALDKVLFHKAISSILPSMASEPGPIQKFCALSSSLVPSPS